MDKDKVRKMRVSMQAALELIEKDFGVKFEVGNASLMSSSVTFKVEGAEVAQDGTVMTLEAQVYKREQKVYSLPDLGTVFKAGGKGYKIVGFNPKADRFPIIAERVPDGKGFKFPIKAVGGKDPYEHLLSARDDAALEALIAKAEAKGS